MILIFEFYDDFLNPARFIPCRDMEPGQGCAHSFTILRRLYHLGDLTPLKMALARGKLMFFNLYSSSRRWPSGKYAVAQVKRTFAD